jgi:coatomer subunit gamma
VKNIHAIMGLRVCEHTDAVAHNAARHSLLLAGYFIGQKRVACHALVFFDEKKQVILKIAIRAEDPNIGQALLDALSS